MKAKYFYLCCIFAVCSNSVARAQEPPAILRQALEKCRRIQNGYYEMRHYQKFMTETDTMLTDIRCHFKKMRQDTLSQLHFYHWRQVRGKDSVYYTLEQVYNGQELAFTRDSSIIIMSADRWAKHIKSYVESYNFHPLITAPDRSWLNYNRDKWKAPVELISKESVGGIICRHLRVRIINDAKPDPQKPLQSLLSDYDFWISEADSLPIRYDVTYKLLMGPDTVWQYDRYLLTKYEFNSPMAADFSLQRLPHGFNIQEYKPRESPELLKAGTAAPHWELPSLNDETVRLADLKGSIVLIDFYYKSCFPCMQALPELQALHEKYKDKGLKVIGINPFDKKSDGLVEFLSKRNINYTTVLDEGRKAVEDYRVSGYPTLYLIDKTGTIVFVQEGYGTETAKELEEEILKHL